MELLQNLKEGNFNIVFLFYFITVRVHSVFNAIKNMQQYSSKKLCVMIFLTKKHQLNIQQHYVGLTSALKTVIIS